MVFNSFTFIVFFAVVAPLHWLLPHRARWVMLLAASCVFYMAWSPPLILLLLAVVLVNYTAARLMALGRRKLWLWLAMAVNFGLLFSLKYSAFVSRAAAALFARAGLYYPVPEFDVLLPMGVSFYTFQAAAYTIDAYRGQAPAERNFLKLTLFITFFPQLVAGPIERTTDLSPQLFARRRFAAANVVEGLKWMSFGFFKKAVVADRLAAVVNTAYGGVFYYRGLAMCVATVAFAFQLYCDFSGYSDIAKGAAKILGIDLAQNFRSPFFAADIQEFWRRWHITLSGWFKDYVYIPLGGSRVSPWRKRLNVFVTFLLSGLWHGANWTFVVWGGLHGAYQVIGDAVKVRLPRFIGVIGTFALFCLSLVFFRAGSLRDALFVLRHMFDNLGEWGSAAYVHAQLLAVSPRLTELIVGAACVAFMLALDFIGRKDSVHAAIGKWPCAARFAAYLLICASVVSLGVYNGGSTFIYFQF